MIKLVTHIPERERDREILNYGNGSDREERTGPLGEVMKVMKGLFLQRLSCVFCFNKILNIQFPMHFFFMLETSSSHCICEKYVLSGYHLFHLFLVKLGIENGCVNQFCPNRKAVMVRFIYSFNCCNCTCCDKHSNILR